MRVNCATRGQLPPRKEVKAISWTVFLGPAYTPALWLPHPLKTLWRSCLLRTSSGQTLQRTWSLYRIPGCHIRVGSKVLGPVLSPFQPLWIWASHSSGLPRIQNGHFAQEPCLLPTCEQATRRAVSWPNLGFGRQKSWT